MLHLDAKGWIVALCGGCVGVAFALLIIHFGW